MAVFKYKARTTNGKIKSGKIKAPTKSQAKAMLARMRLIPVSIATVDLMSENNEGFLSRFIYKDEKGKWIVQFSEPQAKDADLIIFTKQFSTMINSGVPLIDSLNDLSSQQKIRSFGKILRNVREAVENGSKFSDSLEPFPRVFDTLYVAMVRAGEKSGNLDIILAKLVTYIEKASKIRGQVKSAMTYPTVVVVVAIVVVAALLLFVVPTFAKQYSDSGQKLPGLTQILIDASNFLVESWYILFGILFGVFYGIKQYSRTERGRVHADILLLKMPIIGDLLKKIAVGRFCSTMATMLTSGVNMMEALDICASAAGNKVIETFVKGVGSEIEQGKKFAETLGKSELIPQMVVSMVRVGEKTGALDEMLVKVSEFYEDEVDLAVKGMLAMIEPIMIVVIGGSVGFIVIGMYLPVFDLGNTVG